jgi:hypothetical protein
MSDYFQRRDMSNVTAFTDPLAVFVFEFESYEQLIFNESNVAFEISFDGQDVHARSNATGPSSVIHWSDHIRKRVWVRRESGSGGGTKYVQVLATTR